MVPWAHRYLDELSNLSGGGLLALTGLVRHMRPTTCDEAWLERAQDLVDGDDLAPAIRNVLRLVLDDLTRVIDART